MTEQDHFGGSLRDLVRVKQQYPGLSVLRKDFLLDLQDIDVSWRAGADAVLLIASLLEPARLAEMHRRAEELGMQALVELHDLDELESVRSLAPQLVGVNSRNLKTFAMDPLVPLQLRAAGDWPSRWVYESGVSEEEHAALAASSGFDGVLVGESVMRDPGRIPAIVRGLDYQEKHEFWQRIAQAERDESPLIKICGMVWPEDVRLADKAGADILGFVFAPSPRRADARMVASLGQTKALKVGVVVNT
ncbi:MAG: bifunctional indole-3-glycerol phosphate synthase/phosphoribosylanthranilate isomerase, partial [Spirochaetaceae bacterium]